MKRNMVPLLGIAFVVAIISTGVFYGLFAGKLRSSSSDVPGQPVVVAVRDLQRGAVLTAADLRVLEVNGSLGGSFSKPEQAVGATLLSSLKQNEPVLEDRVVTKDPPSGQRHGSVPAGMRAISMRVSDSEGLLGFLRPGARVDVQAVLDRNGIVQLRTVLQNVEILALNSQTQLMSGISGPVFNVTVLTDAATSDLAALVDFRVAPANRFTQPVGLGYRFASSLGIGRRVSIQRRRARSGAPRSGFHGFRRARPRNSSTSARREQRGDGGD
jgi:Flp pilus assembly protein CpaB